MSTIHTSDSIPCVLTKCARQFQESSAMHYVTRKRERDVTSVRTRKWRKTHQFDYTNQFMPEPTSSVTSSRNSHARGVIRAPLHKLYYSDVRVTSACKHLAYIMDIGMYSVTKSNEIVVQETPVLSLVRPCFILIRLLDQVSATRCDGIRAIVLLNKPVQSVFVFVTRPLV